MMAARSGRPARVKFERDRERMRDQRRKICALTLREATRCRWRWGGWLSAASTTTTTAEAVAASRAVMAREEEDRSWRSLSVARGSRCSGYLYPVIFRPGSWLQPGLKISLVSVGINNQE
uniref:Uncharacterized protein n=1 Tax=Oryza sativa subsp. japonica TaxID=39947 RepID=Q654L3_ORYSJ|nr:hypothetical protein [Oryza sativa Japonica Group]